MRQFLSSYRQVLFQAGVISFCINLLLLAPTLYMIQVFDRVFTSRSNETLAWLTVITVAMLGLYWILDWIRARLLASVGALLDRLLSEPVMRRVLEDAAKPTGGRLMFLARDVGVLRNFFGGPGIVAILDSPWLPFFVLLIFFFHPLLGAMSVVATAVLVGIAIANFRLTQSSVEDIQDSTRRAGRFLDIGSRNAEVVMALGMNDAVVRRWGSYNRKALKLQHGIAEKTAWLVGGSRFARQLIQVLMLAAGAYLVIDQHVTPGVMLAVTLILGRALAPVEQLIANWKLIGEARAAYRRLDEVLAEQEGKPFEPDSADTQRRLQMGFFPVGADIIPNPYNQIPGFTLEGRVHFLPGFPVMAWQVYRFVAAAGVHELILGLPKGYATDVGVNGENLSGGQRQRVALARALYGMPRLLILDEPNSNLDAEGERALVLVLDRLKQAKITVIMVCHKPSLLARADKLLVLKEGMIAAFGSREQVLAGLMPAKVIAMGARRERA